MNRSVEKATLEKLGLFQINVYFKILKIVKQLEMINFVSLTDKSSQILELRVISQLGKIYGSNRCKQSSERDTSVLFRKIVSVF